LPGLLIRHQEILFLSYGLAYGESSGIYDIFIGANAVDYSGYPDCRPAFFESFSHMANTGTKAGNEGNSFTIHTPLLKLKKSDIIKMGVKLNMDYSLTHSCYDPLSGGKSCGRCDSCRIREKGFLDAGLKDPAI